MTRTPAHPKQKFDSQFVLRHVATGNHYVVLFGPLSGVRLEKTNEPAYAYYAVVPKDGEDGKFQTSDGDRTIWVRSAKEMEDGRFVDTGFNFHPDL